MKFALATLATATAFSLSAEEKTFNDFLITHERNYASREEYEFRFTVFKQRVAEHKIHNASGATHTVGVNMFTDMTDAEIKMRNGYQGRSDEERNPQEMSVTDLPASVDWRTKGAVTPVKNQGQCGSCWSFSTTGSLEGAHFIATGDLVSLSEQQLVDCSYLNGNMGCQGGMPDRAFRYAEKHAIETEAEYPYTAKSPLFHCNAKKDGVVKAKTFTDVKKSNPDSLKAAIAQQPVSVALEADQAVFHQYTSGIITDAKACGTQLDHAVLAVGYGVEAGVEYYIVKNSWTTAWGEDGYVRIGIQGGLGVCGIQQDPSFPTTN